MADPPWPGPALAARGRMNVPATARRQNDHGARTERALLVFVLLTLAALVAVPVLVNLRVADLRQQIERLEPTRPLVTQLEANLVRQMLALSEALLTQDPAAGAEYDRALAREDSLYRELTLAVGNLDTAVVDRLAEVRRASLIWHDRAGDAEDLLEDLADPGEARPQRERPLFGELLLRTRDLDAAILAHTQRVRARIEAAEGLALSFTVALGLLAVTAGAAAVRLAGRSRRFAFESELRRLEAEETLEELAHETELRQRLLQGITHDVKNPLGAAKGYAELLMMGVKAPVQPEQIPLILGLQRAVDGALQIIGDLLDLARADSGGLTLAKTQTSLTDLVSNLLEVHRAQAEAFGHTLHFEPRAGDLPVETDPLRVQQIVQNLITNALKYTPAPGVITVETELREEGDGGRSWAVVRVRDTGPGIPPGMQERIFDEFTRIEESGPISGHGLGLAIARRIAGLLGGELRVEDPAGPGACFALLLPAAGAATERS